MWFQVVLLLEGYLVNQLGISCCEWKQKHVILGALFLRANIKWNIWRNPMVVAIPLREITQVSLHAVAQHRLKTLFHSLAWIMAAGSCIFFFLKQLQCNCRPVFFSVSNASRERGICSLSLHVFRSHFTSLQPFPIIGNTQVRSANTAAIQTRTFLPAFITDPRYLWLFILCCPEILWSSQICPICHLSALPS